MELDARASAGTDAADAYLFGGKDAGRDVSVPEADVSHFGVRSFTGKKIGDGPRGPPRGASTAQRVDLEAVPHRQRRPDGAVEFLVRTRTAHETTETMEINVAIDVGADGVFANCLSTKPITSP